MGRGHLQPDFRLLGSGFVGSAFFGGSFGGFSFRCNFNSFCFGIAFSFNGFSDDFGFDSDFCFNGLYGGFSFDRFRSSGWFSSVCNSSEKHCGGGTCKQFVHGVLPSNFDTLPAGYFRGRLASAH